VEEDEKTESGRDFINSLEIRYCNEKDGAYLDQLEGVNISFEYMEELEAEGIKQNSEEVPSVVESLKKHAEAWESMGAGKFVNSVISTGLRLNFTKRQPGAVR
jgi:hypothetical protein